MHKKTEILLRFIPIVISEVVSAMYGGLVINIFLKYLPRYSIDLTYKPLTDRKASLDDINASQKSICEKAKRIFKGMHMVPNFSMCKLLCEYRGKQVKREGNQTKRKIACGNCLSIRLSKFSPFCETKVVPLTQLFDGKIAKALSLQHPHDLFDKKYMEIPERILRRFHLLFIGKIQTNPRVFYYKSD